MDEIGEVAQPTLSKNFTFDPREELKTPEENKRGFGGFLQKQEIKTPLQKLEKIAETEEEHKEVKPQEVQRVNPFLKVQK
mmetsp:Transcript_29011/g.25657  ORF Transcript_29011/g.25657 Transcript_29011/m.25657 type:complete len:80 (-) Transcript_29011:25-264(-)